MIPRRIEKTEGCLLRCSSGKCSPGRRTSPSIRSSSRVTESVTPSPSICAMIAGSSTLPLAFSACIRKVFSRVSIRIGGSTNPMSHRVYLPGYS